MRCSRMWVAGVVWGAMALVSSHFGLGSASAAGELVVADGITVTLEYTVTLPDQSVADSNVGLEPISFVQGANQILPGLEKGLAGLKAGQKKQVHVSAAEGFGAYDPKARAKVEKSQVPENVKAGTMLRAPDGRPIKVLEVTEDSVILDLNHPLAGKDLVFDVHILKLEKQPKAAKEKDPEQK